MASQSSLSNSLGICLVTLLSTSVKSCASRINIVLQLHIDKYRRLTETKKLLVPSARSKKSGNSFNHVSSPYMTSFPCLSPKRLALIWASQVSCVARVEVVSDSAKLSMTSRKDGIEPVVMAFTRGMVMVGDVAWAVKGSAVPSRMRL